jgi:hypothetical protein
MERQFLPSAAKLTNGFPCRNIYETDINDNTILIHAGVSLSYQLVVYR